MERVTVVAGQSLLDIAVQATGSVEAAFEIAAVNDIAVDEDLKEGTSLIVPQVVNQKIADHFRVGGLFPKSGIRAEEAEMAPYGGIGYMGIEIDFIVS